MQRETMPTGWDITACLSPISEERQADERSDHMNLKKK